MGRRRALRRAVQPVRLGTAFYDRGRCLPWALATDCIVCEEWCPVSPKAIYVEEAQVIDSAGNTKTLKQPRVDPSRCVGCGACEYACPLQEKPAVYVTSIGESRSPSSQILLKRTQGVISHEKMDSDSLSLSLIVTVFAIGAYGMQKEDPLIRSPSSGTVAGWEKSSETRAFEPKDLWQYIDGDSEQYIQAGVVSTSTSDYKYRDNSKPLWTCTRWAVPMARRPSSNAAQTKDARPISSAMKACSTRRA